LHLLGALHQLLHVRLTAEPATTGTHVDPSRLRPA
jgi:hypothetical protein